MFCVEMNCKEYGEIGGEFVGGGGGWTHSNNSLQAESVSNINLHILGKVASFNLKVSHLIESGKLKELAGCKGLNANQTDNTQT